MAVFKRGNVWWIDVYAGNPPKRIRRSAKTSDEQKARIVEQSIIGVNRGTTPRQQAIEIIDLIMPHERAGVKLSDVCEYYRKCLIDEKADTGRRTIRQRIHLLDGFVAWAKDNTRAITVDDVGADEAFAYQQVLSARGVLGKSLNSYVGDLSTVWKMLQKRSKAKNNPWTLVRVRRDRENEHTGRAFTREEFDRILAVARTVGHEWDGMVIIGAYTGFRQGDVARLKWSECDMASRIINLEPSKTKHYGIQVHLPMHDRVFDYLSGADRSGDYVMPWRAAHPAGYKARGTDVTFSHILRDAGITKADDSDLITFHCLRHTFTSWLYQKGVSEDVRMKMTGHTNRETHAIYTHGIERSRDAIGMLD